MYRAQKFNNRICCDRDVRHRQRLHAEKLRNIQGRKMGTGTLDNRVPETTKLKHMRRKMKKEQIEEERAAEIERENGILLGKITHLMTHSSMGPLYNKAQPSRGDAVAGHSLNDGARKREMMRISHENEAMLQRIMLRKSNYRCVDWLQDRKVQEGILNNLKKVRPSKVSGEAVTLLEIDERMREQVKKQSSVSAVTSEQPSSTTS